jgi:hypothetical protein
VRHLTQVVRDWETVPLLDIVTTGERQCPWTHPEELFYKVWPGIWPTCDCQKRARALYRWPTKKFFVNKKCSKVDCRKDCSKIVSGCYDRKS